VSPFRFARSLLLLLAIPVIGVAASPKGSGAHRRLEIENQFSSAEESLRYFLARDAAGFVWSGYLDSEREEFTTWKTTPSQDGFYLARKYDLKLESGKQEKDRKAFIVAYELESIRDSAGTISPSIEKVRTVRFVMKKTGDKWRVAEPDGSRYSSVLIVDQVRKDLRTR
jgi:hypothetical protein